MVNKKDPFTEKVKQHLGIAGENLTLVRADWGPKAANMTEDERAAYLGEQIKRAHEEHAIPAEISLTSVKDVYAEIKFSMDIIKQFIEYYGPAGRGGLNNNMVRNLMDAHGHLENASCLLCGALNGKSYVEARTQARERFKTWLKENIPNAD